MENYSSQLIEIRKRVAQKVKEINELNTEKQEIWKKIEQELNDNIIYLKKQKQITGLQKATLIDYGNDYQIVVRIDNKPSAKQLSIIEEETGLKFIGISGDNKEYFFGLV